MHYDFDQVIPRRPTDSAKWNRYEADVLPLWVADMDFQSPAPVIQALHERVEHGIFGYPAIYTPPRELPELAVERMARLYGWKITVEDILFLPGVVVGLDLACHAVAQPGGGILMQTPIYPPFLDAAGYTGMVQQENELVQHSNGHYGIDWEAFEAAFTPQTRIFTLCNPHNPVGRVFRKDELERMAEICLRRGVFICSDEIHGELVFKGYRHIPIASLAPEVAQNTMTLIAPTKTFNLAGLQCAMMIVQNTELRDKVRRANTGLVMWANLMGVIAAIAAYKDGQEWLDQLMVYLEANRDFLADFVKEGLPGVKMAVPEGTYLAWLDCREAGINGNPYDFFLKKARVGLNNGVTFGRGGEGFVRLNFACPRATLEEALRRMRQALISSENHS